MTSIRIAENNISTETKTFLDRLTSSQSLLLSKENSYYRSKLFNTRLGINPLIAAASALFSLAGFLIENSNSTEIPVLLLAEDVKHEIKVFENNAKLEQYHSDSILAARYILCAFLDEILLNQFPKEWGDCLLLKYFHQEENTGERFFLMLEKLSQDPEYHIELLELIFLCLNLGYLGQYQYDPNGKEKISGLSDRLFEIIRSERGDLKKELLVAPFEKPRPPVSKLSFPLWLIASFSLVFLLTLYSSFSYMLGNSAQSLYLEISNIV